MKSAVVRWRIFFIKIIIILFAMLADFVKSILQNE
jgi:hypothetical protein